MFSRSVVNQLNLYSVNTKARPAGEDSGEHSLPSKPRRIIVSNQLPVKSYRDTKTGRRSFELDGDSMYVKLRDGFDPGTEVIYVGTLTSGVDSSDESEVETELEKLCCVPVFLEPETPNKRDDDYESHWRAYVKANQTFAKTIESILNPDEDYVWVHDYHLMILATLLRRKFHRARVGFFLHGPFPGLSEIFRNIQSRAEILNSLFNCDIVGFSSFDNAKDFLSGSTQILGRCEWSSKRGCFVLNHHGQTIEVKIANPGNDVANWAQSFDADLSRVCRDHQAKLFCGTGFGLGFRVVALGPDFRKLSLESVVGPYRAAITSRLIFLGASNVPSEKLVSVLDSLCDDPKNEVFVISERSRDSLEEIEKLGIVAEHSFFTRDEEWEPSCVTMDCKWKKMALPEKRGKNIVQVKPQGVSNGVVIEKIASKMRSQGRAPDFVLCIGDDSSDEDMFEPLLRDNYEKAALPAGASVFSCRVGLKPSRAKYYVDDTEEVVELLRGLASASSLMLTQQPISNGNKSVEWLL